MPLTMPSSALTQILSPFKMEKDISALIDIGALLKGYQQADLMKAFLIYMKKNRPEIGGSASISIMKPW